MTDLCLYFQVHQPFRLRNFTIFDIGKKRDYFDEKKNAEIVRKVAHKCYLPANKVLKEALDRHPNFKIAYSITGTALEQFERYAPEVLHSFKQLVDTGRVEILGETYHHSLSFLFDKEEFLAQVRLHSEAIKRHFGRKPSVFRNTELIFNNELGRFLQDLGYKAVLAEGADHVLQGRSPDHVYHPRTAPNIRLLLKNYRLSDDIAFRFGNKDWAGYPVTAAKFLDWASPILGDSINLFMDYETFGEHQWEDTGIFDFLRHLPAEASGRGVGFQHPGEVASRKSRGEIDIHLPVSWADIERDTSAWLGNRMQDSAIKQLYALRAPVLASRDEELIDSWRKLTTSDHFYYMCTKWFADGDVHKYFNPYDSPYECYISFMNVLRDIAGRVKPVDGDWIKVEEVNG